MRGSVAFVILFLSITSIHVQCAATNRTPEKVPMTDEKNVAHKAELKKSDEGEEVSVEFDGEWECGGEDFSKLISQQMIARDCPQLLHVVNNCCIGHDSCYDKQRGQAHCDKIFCDCLDKVTYSRDNSTYICHEEHSLYFCGLVQEFGNSFYEASARNTTAAVPSASLETAGQKGHHGGLKRVQLNGTNSDEKDPRVRIYESKTHNTDRAIGNLPELDLLN